MRGPGPLNERAIRALFQVIGRFPEALGALQYFRDRLLKRRAVLIEYK